MAGYNEQMLMDKLAERYLFEKKSGVVYERVIAKLSEIDGFDVDELKRFRTQEKQHEHILEKCIRECGGNPRQKTPSQMMVEQQSRAFENIIEETDDPSMLLHVLLDAELEESASWPLLIQLCRQAKMTSYLSQFAKAQENERDHLKGIRGLVTRLARQELKQVEVEEQPEG